MSEAVKSDVAPSVASESDADDAASGDDIAGSVSSEMTDITADAFFELLSNRRRRYTLHCLEQASGPVELGDLARQVAAWEEDKAVDAVSASERKNVYTSLQQFHLPKLDEKRLVAFDDREGVVELGSAAEEVDIYIEVVERGNVPWSHYYLGLAAVHALLMVAAYVGVVSAVSVGIFCATSLAVSAMAHTYYTKTEMRLGTGEKPPERDQ